VGHTREVNDVALIRDGMQVISASEDQTLKVWDLASGALIHTLEGHAASIDAVAVTRGGTQAVSNSCDGTLKVWDLASGTLLRTVESHTDEESAVAVTPDGAQAVSTSRDRTLMVWDLASGRLVAEHLADAPIMTCAVGPCGANLVAGDDLGRVHLLRLER